MQMLVNNQLLMEQTTQQQHMTAGRCQVFYSSLLRSARSTATGACMSGPTAAYLQLFANAQVVVARQD